MPEEGEQMPVEHVEPQSNAGKWILVVLAILFVAGAVYGYVTTQQHVDKLTKDSSDSQAQVVELKSRMQTAEASEDALAHQVGLTKKELAQRAAELQAQQKATYPALYGLDKSRAIAADLEAKALAELEMYGERSARLRQVGEFLVARRS